MFDGILGDDGWDACAGELRSLVWVSAPYFSVEGPSKQAGMVGRTLSDHQSLKPKVAHKALRVNGPRGAGFDGFTSHFLGST